MDFSLDLTWILSIIVILFVAAYFSQYFSASNEYWKELNIPYVPRIPVIGNSIFLFRKPFHEKDQEYYQKYGKIYGSYESQIPVLNVADPDLIRKIWVKDFSSFTGRRNFGNTGDPYFDNMLSAVNGDQWKRIRSAVSPAFATGKMRKMTDLIISSAKTLAENIEKNTGKPIDIKKFTNTFTMDVIASVAFGTKVHSYNDPDNEFIRNANKFFNIRIQWRFILNLIFPKLMKLFKINPFQNSGTTFFRNAVFEIIKHRRESGKKQNDFLQLMLDAEDEMEKENNQAEEHSEKNTVADEADEKNKQLFSSMKNFKALSNHEIVAQCVLFFLAGYDTTSSTVCFACNELAKNPEKQTKLKEEVDMIISKHEGKITYECVQEMKYLDQVISETLRMNPPATRVERLADADYTFEGPNGSDITIKKGTVVVVPVYSIHHDPEIFQDPEEFSPERFDQDEKANRHPYVYLPFGAGPRNCVALRFAQVEVKLCLAYLVSQFNILPTKEVKKTKNASANLFGILQPRDLLLHFQKRKNTVKE